MIVLSASVIFGNGSLAVVPSAAFLSFLANRSIFFCFSSTLNAEVATCSCICLTISSLLIASDASAPMSFFSLATVSMICKSAAAHQQHISTHACTKIINNYMHGREKSYLDWLFSPRSHLWPPSGDPSQY